MDWKLFLTTFSAIFIAELGDKTQFAALAISAQTKSTFEVLLGTVLALAIAGAIGVFAGKMLGQFISPHIMKYFSGSFFILVGFWVLFRN